MPQWLRRLQPRRARRSYVRSSTARALGHVTLRQLSEHLNGLGISTARGGQWVAASVSQLLHQLEIRA
jgi:hypothetical protein